MYFFLSAQWSEEEEESEEEGEDPALDSLSQAIAVQVQNCSIVYLLFFDYSNVTLLPFFSFFSKALRYTCKSVLC